jgi:DNA-3-methyladenine glycosylase II
MKAKTVARASSLSKISPVSNITDSERIIITAERHLSRVDSVMKRLIAEHGHCLLAQREYQPFHMLTHSIISQQLSSRAAFTIKQRLATIVPAPFDHAPFLTVPPETLRAAGLSQAKVRYIGELASRVSDGRLLFDDLLSKDDEAVIGVLSELPGIGRWTAQMFLIFALKRLDVLALGDAGLQRAARLLYRNSRIRKNLLERLGEVWRPYRSVASWYLWRSLDPSG